MLGIASIFVCVMLLTNSIMQAHGRVNLPIYGRQVEQSAAENILPIQLCRRLLRHTQHVLKLPQDNGLVQRVE